MKLSAVASDLDLEVHGVRVHYELGIYLIIARAGNPNYTKRLAELLEPHREVLREGKNTEIYDDVLKQVRAETILLGWENVEDDNGKPLLYTPEIGLAYFKDERFKDFYRFIVAVSENHLRFRAKLIKESEGNSSTTSDGSKSGVDENKS